MTSTPHPASSTAELDLGPLFGHVRDAVIVFTSSTRQIVSWNPAAETMFGYTAEQAVGMFIDVLIPDRLTRPHNHDRRLFETQAINRDGDELWVEVTLAPLESTDEDHVLAIVRDESQLRRHTTELSTLTELGRDLASTLELQPLLESLLDRLTTIVESHRSTILLVDGDELRYAAVSSSELTDVAASIRYNLERIKPVWDRLALGEPIIMGDIRDDSPAATLFRAQIGSTSGFETIRALLLTPLIVRDRIIGLLTIARPEPHSITPRDIELAMAVARLAAVAIENARLHERERAAASLEERQRLARELHDSVAQALYSVKLYAEASARRLDSGELDIVREHLSDLRAAAREALIEMRLLLFHLRPSPLAEHGLAEALRARLASVEARSELEIDVQIVDELHLEEDTEQELYRVAQEALNNVLHHANARRVSVTLAETPDMTRLTVADDGDGFDLSTQSGGLGLPGIRERVDHLGGVLRVESSPGQGTTIVVEVPR